MGIVRLGKLLLRWCDHCNVPVLEYEKCGKCGAATRHVEMTPPGDARPAFPYNIHLIRDVLDQQFGSGAGILVLPEDKIVLLNKVPGIDRMEEIVVDGEVLGTLRFDMGQGWRFIMRVNAAQRLSLIHI